MVRTLPARCEVAIIWSNIMITSRTLPENVAQATASGKRNQSIPK